MESKHLFSEWTRRDFMRATLLAGAGLATLDLASCIGQPSSSSQLADTLIVGLGGGPANLNPIGAGQTTQLYAYWRAIFDTLIWTDHNHNYIPRLATSWKAVGDTTWEFALRKNVQFHNGEPFDATSVKFTMDQILDPNNLATIRASLSGVKAVEIVDPYTIRIHTTTPFPTLLVALTQAPIVPAKYVSSNPGQALQHPIGTGPFKFAEWIQGDHISLARNDNFYLQKPPTANLDIRIIPDDSARVAALQAGNIHIAQTIPFDAILEVSNTAGVAIKSSYVDAALVIEFDTVNGGPVTNPLVRQALNFAVDKEQINNTIMSGKEKLIAGQVLTEGLLGYNSALKPVPYDPAKAKQLLAQAGYPNGFDLTLNGPTGRYPADVDILTAVAAQLAKVGVRAQANPMNTSVWATKLNNGGLSPAFLVAWYSFGEPGLAMNWMTLYSASGKYYYKEAQYNSLVTAASQTLWRDPRNLVHLI